MLLYLLCYLIMGIVAIIGYSVILTIKVYKKGYDLDKFSRMERELITNESNFITNVIIGVFIWPIRLYDAICNEHELFNIYERMYESK